MKSECMEMVGRQIFGKTKNRCLMCQCLTHFSLTKKRKVYFIKKQIIIQCLLPNVITPLELIYFYTN